MMDVGPTLQDAGFNDQAQRARGLGRYLRRLRTALRFRKPNKGPKRFANGNPSTKQVDTPEPCPPSLPSLQLQSHEHTHQQACSSPTSAVYISEDLSIPKQPHESALASSTSAPSRSNSNPLPCEDRRVKRATELFERYGIELDLDVCTYENRPATTESIERVEKPIRMRVHHHCHHCCLAIGPTGVCVNCGHKLCKKCYRYPDTRDAKLAEPRERKRKAPSPTRSETLDNWLASTPSTLALRPATRESAISRVAVTRKVRRVCHLCTSPFIWTERVCQDCDHEMCSLCPQDPPPRSNDSLEKPSFLQRDRIFKKPRLRVKYTCEKCGALLQERTDFCSRCGHLRCGDCGRNPNAKASEVKSEDGNKKLIPQ